MIARTSGRWQKWPSLVIAQRRPGGVAQSGTMLVHVHAPGGVS
jgi:hypothetical protein